MQDFNLGPCGQDIRHRSVNRIGATCRRFGHYCARIVDGVDIVASKAHQRAGGIVADDRLGQFVACQGDSNSACIVGGGQCFNLLACAQRVADAGIDPVGAACCRFGDGRGHIVDGIDVVPAKADQSAGRIVAVDRLGQCVPGQGQHSGSGCVVRAQNFDVGADIQCVVKANPNLIGGSFCCTFDKHVAGTTQDVNVVARTAGHGVGSATPAVQRVVPGVPGDLLAQRVAGQVDRRCSCGIVGCQDFDVVIPGQCKVDGGPHFVCDALADRFDNDRAGVVHDIDVVPVQTGQGVGNTSCPIVQDVGRLVAGDRLGQRVAGKVDYSDAKGVRCFNDFDL